MYQVSGISITFMMMSFIICVFVPIIACTYLKRKKEASLKSFWIGVLTFLVFAMFLEQILHVIVLTAWPDLQSDPSKVLLKAAYGGMAAAAFEEMGRYVAMKFFMKKRMFKKEAIMYGIGHGGVEAIIIGGLAGISNIATAISVNTGSLDAVIQSGDQAVISTIEQMVALPAWQFLLTGVERLSAMTLHVCLSYLVYLAVKYKKIEYLSMALVIHFLVDAGTVYFAEFLPIVAIEAALVAVDVIFVFGVYRMYQKEAEE